MTYSSRNESAISTLDPATAVKVRQLLEKLKEIGEDVLITDGYRTVSEQNALYAQGRTKAGKIVTNAYGYDSMHTHGVAIDLVPVGPLGIPLSKRNKLEWAATNRYRNIAAIAKHFGFEWGGDWSSFPDKPHFQYTQGLTILDLKKGKRPSLDVAKAEWREALEKKLANVERALAAPYVTARRKANLLTEQTELRAKIKRLT